MKAFSDTVTLSRRNEMAAERQTARVWLDAGGFGSGAPYSWGHVTHAWLQFVNYEHLKIASGFELHLKARLLAADLVVHEVDRSNPLYRGLADGQKQRPIHKTELFGISDYMFNGRLNYLPGLRDLSIKFSLITKRPKYRAVLALPSDTIDVIDDYRLLRNQIHFPGDIVEAPHIAALSQPSADFVAAFINSEIVSWSNALIATHNLNWKPLDPV